MKELNLTLDESEINNECIFYLAENLKKIDSLLSLWLSLQQYFYFYYFLFIFVNYNNLKLRNHIDGEGLRSILKSIEPLRKLVRLDIDLQE